MPVMRSSGCPSPRRPTWRDSPDTRTNAVSHPAALAGPLLALGVVDPRAGPGQAPPILIHGRTSGGRQVWLLEELDCDQEIDDVGQVSEVTARSFGHSGESVVGSVDVDEQLLGGGLEI